MIRSNNGHSRSINVFLTLHLDIKHNGQIQTKPSWQLLMRRGQEDFEASKEFELYEMENERKDDQIFHISSAKLLQKRPIRIKTVWNGRKSHDVKTLIISMISGWLAAGNPLTSTRLQYSYKLLKQYVFQCKVLNMLNTSAVLYCMQLHHELQFRTVSRFSSSVLVDTDSCLYLLEKQTIFNRQMAYKSLLHKIKQYLVSEYTNLHHISPALMVLSLTLPVETHIFAWGQWNTYVNI